MIDENEKKVKVSILVAVYNIEKYIEKCIKSIINQDYNNIEIILVNDCSSDSSSEICDKYAKIDNRIRVIHHNKNKRLSEVRNTGLDNATGDYVVFIDGDDWIAPDFVSYMLKVIMETNADMAINLSNFTTRDMKQINKNKIEIWSPEKATAELLFPHITIGAWNKIYKREFIEKNKLRFNPELFTAEGYRFISDAAQRANKIGVGNRKVYYYRLNNINSATTKYDIRQSMSAINAAIGIKNDLIIKTPYVINAIDLHIWLNHFWNLRQILALNLKKKYEDEYKKSLEYVRKNAFYITKAEPSINKKIKYYLAGAFPVLAAKIKNIIFDLKLKLDVIISE